MKYFNTICVFVVFIGTSLASCAQHTKQDTLRGSNGIRRSWWDVQHYAINITPDYNTKTLKGRTTITYKVLPAKKSDYLQVDLQQPLKIDTLFYDGKLYINNPIMPFYNEGNVWFIPLPRAEVNSIHSISIAYHGSPRIATNPPWDGGWIFTKDEVGRPWMTVACQGLGASVWYPCKDYQGDEPDNGASLTVTVADSLVAVGNGKLNKRVKNDDGTTSWTWEVKSPINNYNIVPYIGKYVKWEQSLRTANGDLNCEYWVLDYNLEKSGKQFTRDVPRMIACFENWFGPYPFYDDGFKLVESSHLGMEHQSAIAYGNKFMNGYLGTDLSGTGWGNSWDYIIIHESGHEWFANNITTADIADMWVHEGFTDYSEVLFVECQNGKEAGNAYCQGLRQQIANDKPIIGPYGVNKEGSGDMYAKGANLIHIIRQIINDDDKFKEILRGLNTEFYHGITTSAAVEKYIIDRSRKNLSKVFDQYLRTAKIPVLEYKITGDNISYRWANCVKDFDMPVKLAASGEWLYPTTSWKSVTGTAELVKNFEIDKNFYIQVKKAG